MEKHGRNAVAVYLGNPVAHTMAGAVYVRPFVKVLGSRNIFSASTLDQMPKHVSCGLMFGNPAAFPTPDIDRTDYLLMLGANPLVSGGSLCMAPDFPGRIKALKDRGGKLVVVDPYRSRTAKVADEHVSIRPGTDPLLLLGMARTLFEEGLVALGGLEGFVSGLDVFARETEAFSPEAVAWACGVDAPEIRRLARELAAANRAAVYGRIGTCTVEFGTLTSYLVDVLNVLTGNLDRAGGAMFARPGHAKPRTKAGGKGFVTGRSQSRVKGYPEVLGEYPIATLVDEIETPGPDQVRALFTMAGNPVLSSPNGRRLDEALSSLDFMVSLDYYLNETTRRANVILPPAGPFSTGHYDFSLYGMAVRNVANYSPPLIWPKEYELDQWEILLKLAGIAAGQGAGADPGPMDDFMITGLVASHIKDPDSPIAGRDQNEILAGLSGRRGPERILDFMLRAGVYGEGFGRNENGLSLAKLEAHPHGLDLGPLEPALPGILKTPSARIEMAPPAIMEDLNRLKKAVAAGPPKGPVLISRRHIRSNNSWLHNIESLVSGPDRCTLMIHPEDAKPAGLAEGDRAVVASRVGSISAPVEITDDIRPGVVSLPHGWGA